MSRLGCTNCRHHYQRTEFLQRCPSCNEPLEVQVDLAEARAPFPTGDSILVRFQQVLPPLQMDASLSLAEGNTPLMRAHRLESALGLSELFLKDERRNPTGSFKDRGTVLSVQRALELGLTRIGTVSSGNMGASVAAYAARAGLSCYILVSDTINPQKLGPIAVHSPRLITVDGDYGDLYFQSLIIGQRLGIYFANSDDPFRVEGQKTIVYELWEALGQGMADYIVLPLSSGGNMSAILKGVRELEQMGWLHSVPAIIGVQAEGASPIARAFQAGREEISRVSNPRTVAPEISNPYPPSGNHVLRQLRAFPNSSIMTVSDKEILEAQGRLASEEGLFVQPGAATPLAAVMKLLRTGDLPQDKRIICLITGDGIKDISVLEHRGVEIEKVLLQDLHRAIEAHL